MLALLEPSNHDPLAWARPFPADPQLNFARHWHEIALLLAFYFSIQLAAPWVSTRLLGKTYTSLNKKTRINFDIHVVSMVQCVVLITALLPALRHPHFTNRAVDPVLLIFGYSPQQGFLSAITIGYFLWDLYVCVRYVGLFGAGFLLHAFAALYVYLCSLLPYCMAWAAPFLLFELSTPFVNFNWFFSRLPAGTVPQAWVLVNGVLLLVTFFSVRILWGFYAVGMVAYDMWRTRHMVLPVLPVSILALNLSLDVLNVYWFSRMLHIAKKQLRKKKE